MPYIAFSIVHHRYPHCLASFDEYTQTRKAQARKKHKGREND
jgi:hypothetical protein